MQFVFEFNSGNVKVEAETERAATRSDSVMSHIRKGEIVLNIQRNPRGRHNADVMACGCKRYIQRVRNKMTVTEDRMQESICSGCGRRS